MTPQTAADPSAKPLVSSSKILAIWALLALSLTTLFWLTDLDLEITRSFYDPENPAVPWPHSYDPLWSFFYFGTPLFTIIYAVGSLLIVALSTMNKRFRHLQQPSAMMILTLIIGSALLVNMLFKENWGRPRPRQVEQFGGHQTFVPPLKPNFQSNGKSFASGHASIGFSLFFLWFYWRRKKPSLAWVGMAAGLTFGFLIGMGRMVAGAHFFSDVVWAGLLTFVGALIADQLISRSSIGLKANSQDDNARSAWIIGFYGVLAAAMVGGALLTSPVNEKISFRTGIDSNMPKRMRLELGQGRVELQLVNDPAFWLDVQGEVKGFALPGHRVESYGILLESSEGQVYSYRYREEGVFSEYQGNLTIKLNPIGLESLRVYLRDGDILFSKNDQTPPADFALTTKNGQVIHSPPYGK